MGPDNGSGVRDVRIVPGAPATPEHDIAARRASFPRNCASPNRDRTASSALQKVLNISIIEFEARNGLRMGWRQGTSQSEEAQCRLPNGCESVLGPVCDRV